MKETLASRTAEAAAALRASHYSLDGGSVFSDPHAINMIGPYWRRLLNRPAFHKAWAKSTNIGLGPLKAAVNVRSRYTEDLLAQAHEDGINQYVIVGAGLDSFALRKGDRFKDLKVYELDHPATQQAKKKHLQQQGFQPDANHQFVAVNFEQQTVSAALTSSDFSSDAPCFISWLGVTHYLTEAATYDTLESLAQCAAPGSIMVFDYSIPPSEMPLHERLATAALSRITALRGEPIFGHLLPITLHAGLKRMGWVVIEDLGSDGQYARYEGDWPQGCKPPQAIRLIQLQREG